MNKTKNPSDKKNTSASKAGRPPVKFKFKKKSEPKQLPAKGKFAPRKLDKPQGRSLRDTAQALEHEVRRELGLFRSTKEGGRVTPTNKRSRNELQIAEKFRNGAVDGELVLCEIIDSHKLGLPDAKVIERIGHIDDPKAYSLIAIFENDIPVDFPSAAVRQAEDAKPVPLGKRTDLRSYPLVTIDGEDARDFDDAVFAEPDDKNEGHWHLLVAIADVANYVTPDSPLDREAWKRGNSVYFPDRVVPMLPEALSNELCSLKPKVERATMAVHLWIDADGNLVNFQFVRGLMKSVARLTYNQVQRAIEGTFDDTTRDLYDPVIANLLAAYRVLRRARDARGTLELDVPEYKARIENGQVVAIDRRTQQDANKLIEEFMILANVAAATALENKGGGVCLYRVHDEPPEEKRMALADFLSSIGGKLPKGQKLTSRGMSQILTRYEDTEEAPLVNEMMLRSQAQATYSPDNVGHFGLALPRYAHFTSPIRRYADLVVHRALIRAYKLGDDGLPPEQIAHLEDTAEHLSVTERRAAQAERSATERYVAAWLATQTGTSFEATVSGVTSFGLFVRLRDTGADGLIGMRELGDDYFIHDEKAQMLIGRRTRASYRLGQSLMVQLLDADGLTGRLRLAIVGPDGEAAGGKPSRRGPSRGPSKGPFKGKPRDGEAPKGGKKFGKGKPGKPKGKFGKGKSKSS